MFVDIRYPFMLFHLPGPGGSVLNRLSRFYLLVFRPVCLVPLFSALLLVVSLVLPFAAEGRVLSDIDSYMVKEIGKPEPLLSYEVDRPVSPASLTKILTCLMAIERGYLNQEVVITREATLVEPSKAGFREGDRILMIDLVRAAMVSSSNDAAFAIAVHMGGSVGNFVEMMNRRARSLGMYHSTFTNPAGFDKGIYVGNVSTAADLMRLAEYAARNPVFNEVARLERVLIDEQGFSGRRYSLWTHNKLLRRYPYAVGIKTGYTTRAGGCLIARAVKDNRDLLLVMLHARNRWNVASEMFDEAFAASGPIPDQFVVAAAGSKAPAPAVVPAVARRVVEAPVRGLLRRERLEQVQRDRLMARREQLRLSGVATKPAVRRGNVAGRGKGVVAGRKRVAGEKRLTVRGRRTAELLAAREERAAQRKQRLLEAKVKKGARLDRSSGSKRRAAAVGGRRALKKEQVSQRSRSRVALKAKGKGAAKVVSKVGRKQRKKAA